VRLFILFFGFFLIATDVSSQSDTLKQKNDTLQERFYLLQKVKRDGVSLPEIEIKEVTVIAPPKLEKRSELRKYDRLVTNIKRVYPYALMVRARLEKVNNDLKNIPSEKERKEYLKKVEKDVFANYEGDIEQLTITQGRLLIKLIDRETKNTSYELIREYRGKFTAAFWQGIARIFGTNLKEEYDGYGDDALIELIIKDVDAGIL